MINLIPKTLGTNIGTTNNVVLSVQYSKVVFTLGHVEMMTSSLLSFSFEQTYDSFITKKFTDLISNNFILMYFFV